MSVESRANILSCQKMYDFLNPNLVSDWEVVYHSEEHSTAIIFFHFSPGAVIARRH